MKAFAAIAAILLLLPTITHASEARCLSVIDGDTIKVVYKGEVEKVRLIGVDTPEKGQPGYKAAKAFATRMVKGKTVRLELDLTLRDRYGRLLAYVYLPDGRMLNAEIVKQGYGHAYTRYPFKYIDEFRQYEKEAREAGKGLWRR